jgi:hypothetical protein
VGSIELLRLIPKAAQRQEVALVTRGDEIGLAGDGHSDLVIVVVIDGHDARRVGR